MTASSHAPVDSATMLRRDLRHTLRNPVLGLGSIGTPVVFLLLFNYVFGGALSAGMGAAEPGRGPYVDYLVPGIIVMVVSMGAGTTAIGVAYDLTAGIVTRFRTMAIARGSLLIGYALANVFRTLVSLVPVIGITLLMGFRSGAGPLQWVEAFGLLALFALAISWLAIPFGLVTGTPTGANTSTLAFQLLPLLSTAFVSPAAMPAPVRWFAEHQPITPVVETVRGLLAGTPVGHE
ncbi:MAG TPA: ABC transporter permease, partial [Thermomicrobiaceae bacterium]|nr:ABC transporter permease [Thermomicrobiaceae bacterium]